MESFKVYQNTLRPRSTESLTIVPEPVGVFVFQETEFVV